MEEMMSKLENSSGEEFDKNFMDMMIEHHQQGVRMAEIAQDKASHQETKDMAGAIIEKQTEEIDEMKSLQKDWGYSDK